MNSYLSHGAMACGIEMTLSMYHVAFKLEYNKKIHIII